LPFSNDTNLDKDKKNESENIALSIQGHNLSLRSSIQKKRESVDHLINSMSYELN